MIPDPPSHSKCTEKRYPLYPTSSRIELRNASQTLFFAAFPSLFFSISSTEPNTIGKKIACKRRNFIQAMSTFILVIAQNREENYFIGILACPWLEFFVHLFFFIFYSIRCFAFFHSLKGTSMHFIWPWLWFCVFPFQVTSVVPCESV